MCRKLYGSNREKIYNIKDIERGGGRSLLKRCIKLNSFRFVLDFVFLKKRTFNNSLAQNIFIKPKYFK
jgi:hypothetical protein